VYSNGLFPAINKRFLTGPSPIIILLLLFFYLIIGLKA